MGPQDEYTPLFHRQKRIQSPSFPVNPNHSPQSNKQACQSEAHLDDQENQAPGDDQQKQSNSIQGPVPYRTSGLAQFVRGGTNELEEDSLRSGRMYHKSTFQKAETLPDLLARFPSLQPIIEKEVTLQRDLDAELASLEELAPLPRPDPLPESLIADALRLACLPSASKRQKLDSLTEVVEGLSVHPDSVIAKSSPSITKGTAVKHIAEMEALREQSMRDASTQIPPSMVSRIYQGVQTSDQSLDVAPVQQRTVGPSFDNDLALKR
ncbi:hypothetical protein OPT61_g4003 [Boeremia exigua]|uniref:Uncharacterized protein n=1 Tax=Boeremia exigua TaxID=749465 RepID=A0ACC2IFU5_9PLEO|nr:hypothetical protein OPT61_g4003 [Boeremia exigua]